MSQAGGMTPADDESQTSLRRAWFFVVASVSLLAVGGLGALTGRPAIAAGAWTTSTALGLVVAVGLVVRGARQRRVGVDVIAVLALAGTIVVGEPFAGAMVTAMLASGRLLDARAAARARRDLSQLLARAPARARRLVDGRSEVVDVREVARGDLLLVATGDVLPVDGRLREAAVIDESALTGEPLPVERASGEEVRSGTVNAGRPVTMVAVATSEASAYAQIVHLVERSQASSAPFVRLADRLAVVFVPLALVVAGLAWWVSGDPVRLVAVLVVATPCPLLLAAPIAIVSGLGQAARRGVVIKGGGALERLAAGRVVLFDKTGTLTRGRPELALVATAPSWSAAEALRLAASLDQASPHVIAEAVVLAAHARGLALVLPRDVREEHGHGITGVVEGRRVRLGRGEWVFGDSAPEWARLARRRAELDGSLTVHLSVDDAPVGVLLLSDPMRPEAPRMVRSLRDAGFLRVVLVTGDRRDTAESVGRIVGVDAVRANCDPEEKTRVAAQEREHGCTVMVGDGVNDAPALSAADVGVALAARGSSVSGEVADVVLTIDRLDALADAVLIARRSHRIALEAAAVGMGLSLLAMGAAAAGLLPPAAGALVQEVIDLIAIGVALRAVRPAARHSVAFPPADLAEAQRICAQHRDVEGLVEELRATADSLLDGAVDLVRVRPLVKALEDRLLPHELAEEELLLPIVGRALGSEQSLSPLSRTHAEIARQVMRLRRLVESLGAQQPTAIDVLELRRLLYGLYGVLLLHNAQEDEELFSLLPLEPASARGGQGSAAGEGAA